ncbi:MAG: cytochrome c oxidase subunit 3 family protein [Bacteroidetes bacterium]|nr:cytochrome c oxidase subunit 3 family protein [Bacteroidota bacterium]MCH8032497.1 cytochrome c oxidase subunit 3 family protein [Bacteroidota bacterium]
MWLFLFTELILFGGMFIIYSVYRFTHQEEFHLAAQELNTIIGTFNTIILLTSSLTMVVSIVAIQKQKRNLSLLFQMLTIFLALFFMVNKYFEWTAKFHHGIYPGSDTLLNENSGHILFFGLYYMMTGLHGLHVIIGVVMISFMMRFTFKGIVTYDNYVKLENTGLYWHLVDIIWIFLFPLFYLIT